MDGIGNLPEEVLCHILSFLTTKEAALTSILSKRWRNLFTLVPNIDIDDSVFLNPEEGKREREGILQSFMDFVDKVLSLQGDSPIVKFSLKCKTGIDTDRLNRWICNVLRRGVASLDLVLDFDRSDDDLDSDYMYFLPRELFVSPKLVELRLRSEFGVDWWRGGSRDTLLPMVNTLCFESTWILLCDDLEVFLSAFPALEEFHMAGIEWPDSDESVSSQSLRKLTLYAGGFQDWRNPKSIAFDTPNLVYLEYSDYVAADYPKVNLPNLAEAVLDLKVTGHQIDLIRAPDDEDVVSLRLGNVWKLVKGLRNVQRLFISAETLELLSLCCESMPVFNNLKTLRIVSDEDLGWQAMPALLRNSPHLETLILKGLLHHVTEKCGDVCDCIPREDDKGRSLSSCPVKKLEIRGFKGTVREKEMIRHFLESFPCLDEMEVYASADNQNDPTTNLQVNRIYKIVAYKVQGEEVTTETVLQSKSMSQTQMEEISSQFTPRNNRNMYDFVYILHGAPPRQDMAEDYLKEQLDAAKTKLAELAAAKTKIAELDAANETELAANKTELAELDEEYKERQRVLDAMFDRIVEQNPTIASALKARQSATEGSNDQEKKERDVEALLEIMTDLYPDFASALRVMRGGTDLERGETSRDQGELDQTTTSTAVPTDRDRN